MADMADTHTPPKMEKLEVRTNPSYFFSFFLGSGDRATPHARGCKAKTSSSVCRRVSLVRAPPFISLSFPFHFPFAVSPHFLFFLLPPNNNNNNNNNTIMKSC